MGSAGRIALIDRLRGLVILLMALDHTRDFFQPAGASPEDLATTTLPFFITRWTSHLCATGFVFLAGSSAALFRPRWSRLEGVRFLVTRGLWLMVLEGTWVTFSWYFNFDFIHLGVLWAIGGSMVLLGAVFVLPPRVVLGLGITLTVALNLWPVPKEMPVLGLLCQPNGFELLGKKFWVSYAIVPWFGVMACGYGLSDLFTVKRWRRWIPLAGLFLLALFILLRALDGFGDPGDWEPQARGLWATACQFANPSKYPPSLVFQAMTLGTLFLIAPLFSRGQGRPMEVLETFGRVPLFFYLLHLPLAHLLGLIHAHIAHGQYPIPAGSPVSLPLIYGAWVTVLCLLWPLCRYWQRLKRSHRDWWWLSYL